MSRVVVPLLALSLALLTAVAGNSAYANKPPLRTRAAPRSVKEHANAQKPVRPSPNQLRAERLGLGTVKAAAQLLAGRAEPQWIRAAGAPTKTLPGTLRFPVDKGYIVRAFGSGMGGYHQAIDIGGELGLPVRAAGAGLVAYAGDAINGYGNLLIVVHPGGFITTYAHNQKNLVVAGQRVTRGAVIAHLGSTGRSKGPHVHFELLFQGKNCDPMPLFRPAATRKSGEPAAPALSSWKHANKRPKAIRCGPRKHHPDYVKGQPAGAAPAEPFFDDDEGASEPAPP